MRNRYFFLFSVAVIISAFTLVSCIDEPTIAVPPTQMAVLRIGNFSPTSAAVQISVDGKLVNSAFPSGYIPYTQLSNYFDINSGNRTIKVVDSATGATIYNKTFSVSTMNITTLLFIGDYSTVDTLNTFQTFEMDEGKTYVSHAPPTGKAAYMFYNIMTPYIASHPNGLITDSTNKDTTKDASVIDFIDKTGGKDVLLAIDIKAKENVDLVDSANGLRQITATVANKPTILISSNSIVTAPGKNYFVFAAGNARRDTVVIREANPVPVKPR